MTLGILTSLLSAFVGSNPKPLMELVRDDTNVSLEAARTALGVKPDLDRAEQCLVDTAAKLNAFINEITRIEVCTCKPSGPEVAAFLKERSEIMQELAGELAMCKAIIVSGNARKRRRSKEN